MKRILVMMLILMALMPFVTVAAADGTIPWDGNQGVTSAVVDCSGYPAGNLNVGWIHWVLTGARDVTYAEIQVNGDAWTPMVPKNSPNQNSIQFYTSPYYNFKEGGITSATASYTGSLDGNPVLTISHYCPGDYEIPEFPTVALPIAAILGLAFFFQRRKE
ncbi:PEF-CTERM sorting domain-containing protein [Methanolobus sp. ZRKC3]|uniref:PEF-CTERM sorting domain-containing protein n=1 Tax=Methanolobus sp. ZRKC3 TaxID=3125786 RepID=UPI0032549D4B